MNLERINCPICGKDNTEVLFKKGDLNLDITNVICKSCALVYINPRPTSSEFLVWQGDSGKGSGHHSRADVPAALEKIEQTDDKIKNGVAQFLSNFTEPNFKILDIGCGFGTLLTIIKQKHPSTTVSGIELNKNDVDTAKTLFGLDLFYGTLEKFYKEQSEQKYDLIILHHTFEHFADPLAELARIKDLLTSEGLLYIAVPNIMNMKKRPDIFFQLGHAFSYSPASLAKILNHAGFKITAFNLLVAYPGGMECLAKKSSSSTTALQDSILDLGSNYQDVADYVVKRAKTFNLLRSLRDNILFFLPKSWRINLGRKFYLFLKKRK